MNVFPVPAPAIIIFFFDFEERIDLTHFVHSLFCFEINSLLFILNFVQPPNPRPDYTHHLGYVNSPPDLYLP